MEGPAPNEVVYSSLIAGYAEQARVEEAGALIAEMRNAGLNPGVLPYNSILKLLCSKKAAWSAQGVAAMLDSMRDAGSTPTVTSYNIVLSAFRDDVGYMRSTLRAMTRDRVSPDAYTLTTLLRSKMMTDLSTVRRLREQAEKLGVKPDRYFFNALVGTLAHYGGLRDAEDVVTQMSNANYAPDVVTYAGLVAAYFRHASPAAAMEVYARAVRSSARLDLKFYTMVLDQVVEQKLYDDAVRVADDMVRAGFILERAKYGMLLDLREDEEGSPLELCKSWFGLPNARYA
jgi:pentatricopeptide repeat protein